MAQSIKAERQWSDIFKVLKELKQSTQHKNLYLAKLSLKNETEIKTF